MLYFWNSDLRKADPKGEMEWFRKSAEKGDSYSQYMLSLRILELTKPCPKKCLLESFDWLHKAAENGSVQAQFHLGIAYESGKSMGINLGIKRNYSEAAKWYLAAAQHEFPEEGNVAQDNLGHLYAEGHGVKQSWVEAYFWYSLFTENALAGKDNIDDANEAATHLTSEQVKAVDQRVLEWKPSPIPAPE